MEDGKKECQWRKFEMVQLPFEVAKKLGRKPGEIVKMTRVEVGDLAPDGVREPEQQLSSEEIERRARESVEKVLKWFTKNGIILSKVPTVKYVDKDSPFDGIDMPEQVESFLARVKIPALSKVNIDTELMVKGAIIFGAFILSAFYKREYDLDISTSAVSDFVDFESLSNDLRKKFPDGAFETDVNIVIYKPMQSFATYNPEIFDEYIAHELWHLVENSYNVLLTDVFIHEATATYVQKVYVGKEVKSCQLAKFNVFGLLYKYGALIVQEELKGESEPLQALLNSEIRERIQLRFDKEVFPKVIDLISVDLCTEDPEDEYILKHEAYAKFRTNPTFENLISGLKTRGLNRFIDEIQGQDTNKFFDHAKRLIAKK